MPFPWDIFRRWTLRAQQPSITQIRGPITRGTTITTTTTRRSPLEKFNATTSVSSCDSQITDEFEYETDFRQRIREGRLGPALESSHDWASKLELGNWPPDDGRLTSRSPKNPAFLLARRPRRETEVREWVRTGSLDSLERVKDTVRHVQSELPTAKSIRFNVWKAPSSTATALLSNPGDRPPLGFQPRRCSPANGSFTSRIVEAKTRNDRQVSPPAEDEARRPPRDRITLIWARDDEDADDEWSPTSPTSLASEQALSNPPDCPFEIEDPSRHGTIFCPKPRLLTQTSSQHVVGGLEESEGESTNALVISSPRSTLSTWTQAEARPRTQPALADIWATSPPMKAIERASGWQAEGVRYLLERIRAPIPTAGSENQTPYSPASRQAQPLLDRIKAYLSLPRHTPAAEVESCLESNKSILRCMALGVLPQPHLAITDGCTRLPLDVQASFDAEFRGRQVLRDVKKLAWGPVVTKFLEYTAQGPASGSRLRSLAKMADRLREPISQEATDTFVEVDTLMQDEEGCSMRDVPVDVLRRLSTAGCLPLLADRLVNESISPRDFIAGNAIFKKLGMDATELPGTVVRRKARVARVPSRLRQRLTI